MVHIHARESNQMPSWRTEAFDENHKRLSYDSWASVKGRFFYNNIPKTGCTLIKKMLQAHCGLSVPEGVNLIHSRAEGEFVKSICDFNPTEQLYLLNSDDVDRICVVRNPYTRLLSGYWGKVVGLEKYGNIKNPAQADTSLNSHLLTQLKRTEYLQQLFKFFDHDFRNFKYAKI